MDAGIAATGTTAGKLFSGPAQFENRTPWGPWSGLLAAVAITGVGMAVSVGLMIMGLVGGRGAIPGDNVGIELLGVWQVLVVLLTLLVASWKGRPAQVLSLGAPAAGARSYWGALGVLLLFQVAAAALELAFIPNEMFRDLRQFVDLARGPYWLLVMVVIAIGAPLSEELLFRGFLLPALAKWPIGFRGAALVTTSLWTLLHLGYSVYGLIEVFLVGLIFSWLLWRTGSLRVTIVCHAVYNGLIILVLRYAPLPAALTAG